MRNLLLAILLVLLPAPWLPAQDLDAGLVAWYRFDGNFADATANGHHGSASGATTPGFAVGVHGQAASFDGLDDALRFPGIPNTAFGSAFSISFYLRKPNPGKMFLVGKRDNCGLGNHFDSFLTDTTPGTPRFELANPGNSWTAGGEFLPDNQWRHYVMVRNGSNAVVYTDGDPGLNVGSIGTLNFSAIAAPLGISISPCLLSDPRARFFKGQIDELRVYNRALTPAEALALSSGEGVVSSGSVAVAPAEVGIGGHFVVSVPASAVPPAPTAPVCSARIGVNGADIGTLAQGPEQWSATLAVPAGLAPGAHDVHVRCTSGASTEIGRSRLTLRPAPVLQLERNQGYPGLSLAFNVSGLSGDRVELIAGGQRVYGPAPAPGGSASGRFSVPLGSSPALQVEARGLSGRLRASAVSVTFTRAADPGFEARLETGTIPGSAPPETALTVSGRIEAADGQPGSRTINVYFRSQLDGRVIPLGARDVVPDAQGNFSIPIELPSAATQDGYIARGPGEIFYTFTRLDRATGGLRTVRVSAGITQAQGYQGFGEGARAQLTVRDDNGNPLPGAYVVIAGEQFLAPPDGSNSGAVLSGPPNQLTAGTGGTGANLAACPVNLAHGYTDGSGRFEFAIDPNAVQRNANWRGAACALEGEGCIDTIAVDATISVYAAHLGYGPVEGGIAAATVIPAQFRLPEAGGIGGRFENPATGQPYNSSISAWLPVVSLQPIVPQLAVLPYRRRGNMEALGDGPGGSEYVPLAKVGGYRTPGRFFDLASASPQGCGASQVCIEGGLDAFELSWFHDPNISGSVQQAKLVVCANDSWDCASGTEVPLVADAGGVIGAACGLGLRRWSAVLPTQPRTANRVRGRLEVRTLYTPPGGGAPQELVGRSRLQLTLDPIPDWFNGTASKFSQRRLRQEKNGLVIFRGLESLTGGGPNAVNASSGQFNEVNLASPQRNHTDSERNLDRWLRDASTPTLFDASEFESRNELANNPASPVRPDGASLPGVQSLDVETIIDTGKIPLFRFTYGIAPIAAATLGADFWLQAALRYGGEVSFDEGAPNLTYITQPSSEFGLDLFFDLSAIAGLVSASVEAAASVYLSNESRYSHAEGLDPSTYQCFGFDLKATFEICVLFCASHTQPLIGVYEHRPDDAATRNRCVGETAGMPGFPQTAGDLRAGTPQRPSLRAAPDASIAYAADGLGAMVYADDAGRVVMQTLPPRYQAEPEVVVEQAQRVTSTATAALTLGGGVLLWSEVPGVATSLEANTQAQHIRWARITPEGLSAPANLTAPGSGDGNVVVGVCPPGRASCPARGEVTAAWVRRIGASWDAHHYALMTARYNPATRSWSTPTRIDGAQGQNSDLQPTVVYRTTTGVPVVAWVRKPSPGLANPEARRIAYRFLDGSSPVRVAGDLPAAVSWPSLTQRFVDAGAVSVEELVLAYTVNVDPVSRPGRAKAFIGNTNALHVARGSFGANGSLSFVDEELRDRLGRNLRAEKPSVIADDDGAVAVGFNGLGFGPDANGNTQRVSDPIGMLSGQGDLVVVRPRLDGTPVSVIDVDFGVLGAFKPAFAFNPALDRFDAVSQPLNIGGLAVHGVAAQFGLTPRAKGEGTVLGSNARLAGMGAGPDFRVEAASAPTRVLTPGATLPVSVRVRNLGRAHAPGAPGEVMLVATWDAPDRAATAAASVALPTLVTDAASEQLLNVPVPAGIAVDEPHSLVLTVRTADSVGEADASDNARALHFGSMPLPVNLRAIAEPGQTTVFLRWDLDDPADTRVAGYRVFMIDDDGRRIALGSTPINGFADSSAAFGQTRRYVVVSHSANGMLSAESAPIDAAPMPALLADAEAVFANGFEEPAP